MDYSQTALVLAGHGSTQNSDSSPPTFYHAETLRSLGLFAEIHECFWKEEPNFRHIWMQVEASQAYVVPNFISQGYFTEQVLPRELGLTGPITHSHGKEIFYCDPVGQHPAMVPVLLQRAHNVVQNSSHSITDPSQTACLFLVGHGTSLNQNSTQIIHQRAHDIRCLGAFADCQATLMEQKPFIANWRTLTDLPDIVVVPFFISDGLHSFEDIPVLLGISDDPKTKGFPVPYQENHRRLWYATAIGNDPMVANVILEQIEQFNETYRTPSSVA